MKEVIAKGAGLRMYGKAQGTLLGLRSGTLSTLLSFPVTYAEKKDNIQAAVCIFSFEQYTCIQGSDSWPFLLSFACIKSMMLMNDAL